MASDDVNKPDVAEFIECKECGFTDSFCNVQFTRQTANGDWCKCPECGKETAMQNK